MNQQSKTMERRRDKRYVVKGGIVELKIPQNSIAKQILQAPYEIDQFFMINPNPYAIEGEIRNISKGGLSFQYLNWNEKLNDPDSLELSISFIRVGFQIHNIPYTTTADFQVIQGQAGLRQRGIAFGKMVGFQQKILDHFFQNLETDESE